MRHGIARAYVPSSSPIHAYRASIAAAAKKAGSVVTDSVFTVTIVATFARKPSHMNKSGLKKTAPALPRADVDNIAKAVLDALHGVAWNDDKQVECLAVRKTYGPEGKTEVLIETDP
tara:strand:+ start:319 stop:669 length:351 start_codon:yes stop_codon:yes gene_type:complete